MMPCFGMKILPIASTNLHFQGFERYLKRAALHELVQTGMSANIHIYRLNVHLESKVVHALKLKETMIFRQLARNGCDWRASQIGSPFFFGLK